MDCTAIVVRTVNLTDLLLKRQPREAASLFYIGSLEGITDIATLITLSNKVATMNEHPVSIASETVIAADKPIVPDLALHSALWAVHCVTPILSLSSIPLAATPSSPIDPTC